MVENKDAFETAFELPQDTLAQSTAKIRLLYSIAAASYEPSKVFERDPITQSFVYCIAEQFARVMIERDSQLRRYIQKNARDLKDEQREIFGLTSTLGVYDIFSNRGQRERISVLDSVEDIESGTIRIAEWFVGSRLRYSTFRDGFNYGFTSLPNETDEQKLERLNGFTIKRFENLKAKARA